MTGLPGDNWARNLDEGRGSWVMNEGVCLGDHVCSVGLLSYTEVNK